MVPSSRDHGTYPLLPRHHAAPIPSDPPKVPQKHASPEPSPHDHPRNGNPDNPVTFFCASVWKSHSTPRWNPMHDSAK